MVARLLEKLQAMPDGDGSVLDHSLIFYGSGMANSNVHATDPLPMVAVGGGLGRGNRHIVLPKDTQIGNLWLTVANQFGSRAEDVRPEHRHHRAVRMRRRRRGRRVCDGGSPRGPRLACLLALTQSLRRRTARARCTRPSCPAIARPPSG